MLAIPTIATLFTVTAIVPRLALATIDNTCEAQRLTKAASDFGRGYYEITNAATGEKISYKKQNGRWLYPAKDQASTAMELIPNEDVIGWHIIRPQDSGAKCASAQWNYTYCGGNGCDWAAVLYQCAVGEFTYKGSTLETDKQYWLFVPSEKNPDTHHIVAVDHLADMVARGWKGGCTQQTSPSAVLSTCLEELDESDPKFQWYITKPGQGPVISTAVDVDVSSTFPSSVTSTSTGAASTCSTKTVTVTITQLATVTAKSKRSMDMHTIPTEVDGKAKRALNRQNAEASSPELEAPLLQQTKRPDRDTERLKQAEVMRVAKALKPAHRYMRWD